MQKKYLSFRFSMVLAAIAASFVFSSCGPVAGGGSRARYEAYDRPASLPKNPSAVRVKVSIKNRMAYVMEGNKPLLVMPLTVGKPSTPTPLGNFRIFNKEHYHRAYTHGYIYKNGEVHPAYLKNKPAGWGFKGTPMPYWCEFAPAYGFHTGWMKPYPASHGCLRMHKNVAPKFFRLVKNGTPVNIAMTQPEDKTIGRNIPRPPDASPFPPNPPKLMVTEKFFTQHKKPVYQ